MDFSSDDDEAFAGPAGEESALPKKKNKRGKIVSSRERFRIVNLYKANLEKDPNLSKRKMGRIISQSTGISETTVYRTITEYNVTKTVTSPKRKRVRQSFLDLFDEFARNAVRGHIQDIRCQGEIPTVTKIHKAVSEDKNLPSISRTSLHKLIKELQLCKSEPELICKPEPELQICMPESEILICKPESELLIFKSEIKSEPESDPD